MRRVKQSLVLLIFLMAGSIQSSTGQFLGGIFSQKNTDLNLVGQQIALLQLYVGGLEKGYQLARKGLATIGDSKRGDLDLQATYFNSLKTVNPSLRRSAVPAGILERQTRVLGYCRSARHQPRLSAMETSYIIQLTTNLIDAATATLTNLADLLTNEQSTMTDGARMERLQIIDQESDRQLRFAILMHTEVEVLANSQQQERNNIQSLQHLNP